ncbi:hypothetical protein U8Y98_00790 [Priestia megaterium]|uniref:hypothetical protein n=1 Tax=Priestia megaterium TaxID=1404 RepID=UPI002FE41139
MDILNKIKPFMGEVCSLYNENGQFLAKGRLQISTFSMLMNNFQTHGPMNNIDKVEVTIKDIDMAVEEGAYSVHSIVSKQGEYISLNVKNFNYRCDTNDLTQEIDLDLFSISNTDQETYNSFLNKKQELDWTNILIPDGCTGGDSASKADAFESLCQEIIQRWGAKVFSGIGKGTDRGRDGTFQVEADSWIPITTNYSNSWILQCKYSETYKNLEIRDIYPEMIKVIMHQPDYYLLMTNRKITNDFNDWFDSNLMQDTNYFIPFKKVIIGRQQLEHILVTKEMIDLKRKYFG